MAIGEEGGRHGCCCCCSLKEARLPEQRLVDGKLFPLVLTPSSPCESAEDASSLLKASKALLEQKLEEHGALFLRGFPLQQASHFNSVVEALGWVSLPYLGSAPRSHVVGSVFTANDANPNLAIAFHHEMAQIANESAWPTKVLFFCETAAPEGGQTPIIVSHKVTQGMWAECPEFMQKLEEQGLINLKVLPMEKDPSHMSLQGWPAVFGTTDRKEAEDRAKQIFNAKVEWLPGDKMKMMAGPCKATRNYGREGLDAWFNMVAAYHSGSSRKKGLSFWPYDVVFGDESSLPEDAVEACKRIHEENSVDIPWQKGDLMIIDNFAVMHGRRAFKPPRQILVSLCK